MTKIQPYKDYALKYYALDWVPVPVKPKTKNIPLIKWRKYQDERPTKRTIRRWMDKWPNANIAIPTGEQSGLLVLDPDDAVRILDQLEGITGIRMPETIHQVTGRKDTPGMQFFFRHPGDGRYGNQTGCTINGIKIEKLDCRGDGGYVIVPPSIHPSGKRYKWGKIDPTVDGLIDLAGLPFEYIELFDHNGIPSQRLDDAHKTDNRKQELDEAEANGVPKGERNSTLARIVGRYLGKGTPQNVVLAYVKQWNTELKEPLAEKDLVTTFESICKRHKESEFFIDELNQQYACSWVKGKFLILRESWDPETDKPELLLSPDSSFFKSLQPEKVETMYKGKYGKHEKARVWFDHPRRRQYEGIVYIPKHPLDTSGRHIEPKDKTWRRHYFNAWNPWPFEPVKGDWSLLKSHIKEIICSGKDEYYNWLMSWLAYPIQHPAEDRMGTSIVMQSGVRVGKGQFVQHYGRLFYPHFTHIQSHHGMLSNFNSLWAMTQIAYIDEAYWAGSNDSEGIIKALISENTWNLEYKYIDPIEVANRLNLIFSSNNPWVVHADRGASRFFCLNPLDTHANDFKYFSEIEKQMKANNNQGYKAFFYDLLYWDQPEDVNLREPPSTFELMRQIMHTMRQKNTGQYFWYECLVEGRIVNAPLSQISGASLFWPETILTEELYQSYINWNKDHNIKHVLTHDHFLSQIREVCPDILKDREGTGERKYLYRFPTLKQCKDIFYVKTKVIPAFEDIEKSENESDKTKK